MSALGSVRMMFVISSLAVKDLPAPDTPGIKELPFKRWRRHILGNDILPVVHAVFVADFLHTERDKHRKALRGKCPRFQKEPGCRLYASRVFGAALVDYYHKKPIGQ